MQKLGHWRTRAKEVIAAAYAEAQAHGETSESDIMRRVDAAYPFGERNYTPYKDWLKERRLFRVARGWAKMPLKLTARQKAIKAEWEAAKQEKLL